MPSLAELPYTFLNVYTEYTLENPYKLTDTPYMYNTAEQLGHGNWVKIDPSDRLIDTCQN